MEPRIVDKPAFTVVGLPFAGAVSSGPYEDGASNNEIGPVWEELNRRFAEIRGVCGPAIGLCIGMPGDAGPWYIAGFEVERAEDLPAGMVSRTVPAQKYAVFPCTLPAVGATYRYIMEEWQSRSGYEHAGSPDFELYDEKWDPRDPLHSPMYVYWPIR
jgi:AraC family transcriptional regulator